MTTTAPAPELAPAQGEGLNADFSEFAVHAIAAIATTEAVNLAGSQFFPNLTRLAAEYRLTSFEVDAMITARRERLGLDESASSAWTPSTVLSSDLTVPESRWRSATEYALGTKD